MPICCRALSAAAIQPWTGEQLAQHSTQLKPSGHDKSRTKSAVQTAEVGRSVQAAIAILQGQEAGQRGLLLSLMHQSTAETGEEYSARSITLPSASSR